MSANEGPKLVGVGEVAGDSIRRIRSQVGLAAFGITLLLGLKSGAPISSVCPRAVGVGIVASTVAWGVAVSVYRHLLRARIRAALRNRG